MRHLLQLRTNQPCFSEAEGGGTPPPADPPAPAAEGAPPEPNPELPGGEPSPLGGAGNETEAGSESQAGAEGKEPEGDPPADAPLEITLPEGFTVDEATMSKFQEYAKTNGLSKEAAQAAIDMYVEQANTQAETFAKAQQTAWQTTIDTWKGELETDPEFAGDKKTAAFTSIGRAFDSYGAPGVREAFDLTGAGWNPAIVRTFLNMARALDEGAGVAAGGRTRGPQTPGQALYGNSEG